MLENQRNYNTSMSAAHDFKYNKVPLFARKTENINTSMSAAP